MLDKLIVTYALVRYSWHEGCDHLDCFWPFALRVMPPDRMQVDLPYIRDFVKATYELEIPLHAVGMIMRRAEKEHYIERIPDQYPLLDKYSLSEKGVEYIQNVEMAEQVERRMNALFTDIKQFVDGKTNESILEEDISTALLSFIRKNMEPLVEFFNPSIDQIKKISLSKSLRSIGNHLVSYAEVAEREKPEHYSTLRDIVLGSVFTTVLNAQDIPKAVKQKAKGLKKCTLYLDTNIVFSILGLHERPFNEAAKELLSLIKSRNFALKVFSFTTDEISRVMNHYLTERDKYPASLVVENSIYSNLKRQGWTKADVRDFVRSIEQKLHDFGIEIEIVPEIDLNTYKIANETLRTTMERYKPNQGWASQNHDLAAIETTKNLRKYPVRRIENSKMLFLTADRGLSRFNFFEMGHKDNGTIGEVILDSLFTNIIWLSDPSANVSLKSTIAAHSHGLFVKREVWLRFFDALKKVKEESKVDDQAIANLFYDNYIENELTEFDEARIDEIDEIFALDRIEEAGKLMTAEREEREAEFISHLTKAVSEAEQKKEQEFADRLETIKKNLRIVSKKTGRIWSIIISTFLSLVAIAIFWGISIGTEVHWTINLGDLVALGFIWSKLRSYSEDKIMSFIYQRKLKEIDLADNQLLPSV